MRTHAPALDEVLHVLDRMYAAAIEPGRMVDALDGLNSLLKGRAVQLCSYDRQTGEVIAAETNSDPSNRHANEIYVAEWGRHDPRPPVSAPV